MNNTICISLINRVIHFIAKKYTAYNVHYYIHNIAGVLFKKMWEDEFEEYGYVDDDKNDLPCRELVQVVFKNHRTHKPQTGIGYNRYSKKVGKVAVAVSGKRVM